MNVGLEEIERHWSICDVWDANIVLNELDAAEAEAYEK